LSGDGLIRPQQVVNAFKKDGWTITHNPSKVRWKTRKLQVDLGSEKLIAAEKDARRIAVDIKSFIGANDLEDLYQAIGQFILYCRALRKADPDRVLVFDKHTEDVILWKT